MDILQQQHGVAARLRSRAVVVASTIGVLVVTALYFLSDYWTSTVRPVDEPEWVPTNVDAYASCLHYISHVTHCDELFHRPRPLPKRSTPLVAKRWSGVANKSFYYERMLEANGTTAGCFGLLRYKVINGTAYVAEYNVRQANDAPYPYQNAFNEMLIIATWLYDLPDMDILYSWGDGTNEAREQFPGLAYCLFKDYPTWLGYTIPHGRNWEEVGYSTSQLRKYTQCLDHKYPFEKKKPVAYWRGSANSEGNWGAQLPPGANRTDFVEQVILNQREYIAIVSHIYPFLDVGLHTHSDNPRTTPGVNAMVDELMFRPGRPFEEWNEYAVLLSLSGFGYTDRMPRQMLFGSPMLRSDDHVIEWFQPFLKPGENIQTFAMDASDYVSKAKQLVEDFRERPEEFKQMIAAQRQVAIEHFNLLAVLDAFVYALVDAASHVPWKVELTPEFVPVPKYNHAWFGARNGVPDSVKQAVREAKPLNFLPVWFRFFRGCFPSAAEQPLLPVVLARGDANLTVIRCAAMARGAGFLFFGLVRGNECHAGNELPVRASRLEDRRCDIKCAGGTDIFDDNGCGGDSMVSVYQWMQQVHDLPIHHVGCVRRAAFTHVEMTHSEWMTVQKCAHIVANLTQHRFFGVTGWATWCVSGLDPPREVGDHPCWDECLRGGRTHGDHGCGGDDQISVYTFASNS